MAERTFCILTTNTNLAEKTITIEFNLEIEEENTCTKSQNFTLAKKKSNSKSIIRNMKPEKEKKEKGINCFLLFNKSNLSKMKKDLLKKEELIKSQENN